MRPTRDIGPGTSQGAERGAAAGEDLWLFTLDHRRLALLHAALVGLALCVAVFLAAGLALQPLAGRAAGLDAESYRRVYSVHGLVAVFLVAIPAVPGVLGNWLLPGLLGLERMALPRLNLLSFHLLAGGGALLVLAALWATPDAGWSFDLPFALRSGASLAWTLLALTVLAVSYACSGANVIATVIVGARAGRGWHSMPLCAWSLAAAALVQALVAPMLVVVVVLLLAQRAGAADVLGAATVAADARFHGWFWLWGHPAFTALVLGALGLVAHVVEAHAGRAAAASRAAVVSLLALAILGFAAAGVHALGRGSSPAAAAASSALALASGVPFAVLAAGWLAALRASGARLTAALAYAAGSIVLFAVGGLSGVFLAVLPTGVHLQNTVFATAQLHCVAAGGVLFALLAGVHQAWPSWFGAPAREGRGVFASLLLLSGTLACFGPLFVLGYLGQPARSAEVVAGGEALASLSAAGGALCVLGLLLAGWNLLSSLSAGRTEPGAEASS